MRLRYVQSLYEMSSFYERVISMIESDTYAERMLLTSWGMNSVDKVTLIEEKSVLDYLNGLSSHEYGVKPSKEVADRCFNRQIAFLQRVYNLDDYNLSRHRGSIAYKKYKACRHYLFHFSLPAWYRDLP